MPTPILMPALSPTMTEGTLAKWHVKEGDTVEAGDVIAEIETDKATMEVEAVDEGKVGKIIISEGTENVPVNEAIAVLLEEGEDASAIEASGASEKQTKTEPKEPDNAQRNGNADQNANTSGDTVQSVRNNQSAAALAAPAKNGDGRIFASPLAKRLANEKGLDLRRIQGSGPHERIVKDDIMNAKVSDKAQSDPAPSYPQSRQGPDARALADAYGLEYEAIPNNNIRRVVARRLSESKQTIPHFYLTTECRLDNLLKARKEINEQANGEYKVSVNDMLIKSCAMALNKYPAANVAWTEEAILQFKHADISVAVATPNGLITPILKKAETKGFSQISREMKDLAGRAREGKLKPEEFQGGTFSLSNLGMYGISDFSAIINPPQSCILAVGAGEQKPFIENGEVKVGTFMKVTLSTDHRSVDGAVGAEYLQILKQYIENPVSMLI